MDEDYALFPQFGVAVDTEGEEEDEDYIPPIRSVTRVSSNHSTSSSVPRPISYEEELQVDEEDEEEEEEEDDGEEEEEEPEMLSVENVENVVEVVNVDETQQQQQHDRKSEKEESSSSSTKRTESEGNEVDGVCCSICMEPWTSEGDHQVSCLPCGHLYGLSCIKRWIQQHKRSLSKCPQCGRKCSMKDIIRLYVSRLVVTDGEQQKKLHSHQAENDFLKMQVANLHEKIQQDKEERLNKEKEKRTCVGNVSLGDMGMPSEFISMRCTQEQMVNGQNFGLNPAGRQGSSFCSFTFMDELVVDGGRVFDMDVSNDILLLARRRSGMGGEHVLTKMSLMYPYESENISLPPGSKAVRDIHISPSGRLALFASLGKKASILSMDSDHFVLKYELPAPAWSCSWDLNCEHQLYAGLQNGMLLVFDMRQISRPVESMNGLTSHPVHTIHSLVDNIPLSNGGRTLLTASSIGPCVWKTGNAGEKPVLVSELENQGVCISLAYSPITENIVASFRSRVQISNDTIGTYPSVSPSPTGLGQGVVGSHVLIKRLDGNTYQNLGSTTANVNDIRMSKSAIINLQNQYPLFAYGDEATRELTLQELPSLRVVQRLDPNPNPILDIKYSGTHEKGLLGCVSEDRLQLFSLPRGREI